MPQITVTPSTGTTGGDPEKAGPEPACLRILGWDHPRCMAPLRAAAVQYRALYPSIELSLQTRPLASFNDELLDARAQDVDLVVFDHPMVPQAASAGALLALDLTAEALNVELALTETVGASAASYESDGHVWGIAVDAACQVAAARADQLRQLGVGIPETWEQVLALANDHPGSVALPLYPSDAFCALLSIAAAISPNREDAWQSAEAIEVLVQLVRCVDPDCFELNPPSLLKRLEADRSWAYVPLMFGYANMNLPGLEWCEAPRVDRRPPGAVLGGAGLGLTRDARSPTEALRFALWYGSAETQGNIVLAAGGQPAAKTVWDDADADAQAHGLFSRTRQTIEHAVVRPRTRWWAAFQAEASRRLHHLLAGGEPVARIRDELSRIHDQHEKR